MTPVRIGVPSAEEFLEPVQIVVEKVGSIAGVEQDDLTSLSIAVLELVKNGMEHGNDMDPDKEITICLEVLPGSLRVQVGDQGSWTPAGDVGFKPGEGDQLYSDRGRGILIARNLARWVDFDLSPEGKTLATLIWPIP